MTEYECCRYLWLVRIFCRLSTRDFDEDKALIAIAHMKQAKVVDMDETIAIHAAKISNEKKIPMADSIIYATATVYNATVYTQDDDFKELKGVKYFAKKK